MIAYIFRLPDGHRSVSYTHLRVEDTYYMVSTTMHFMPGCEILQSFDLVHWEHATYVYETLDHTDAQQLKSGQNIYGQGMCCLLYTSRCV